MKKTFIALLFITFIINIQAQDTLSVASHRWGEISDYEKNLKACEFDSTAKAVVLFHSGIMNFGYKDGFRTYYHKRIKIFDQDEASQLAQVKLYYIQNDYSDNEKYWKYGAKEIRAQAINFDKDGNKIITELSKEDILNETKNSKYNKYKKFTIPNVKAGTIIEFSYVIQSWYLMEENWFFQEEFPTLESSFELYSSKQKMAINPIMIGQKLFEKYNGKSVNKWTLNNVPAIKDETYSASKEDFAEHIIFKPSGFFKSIRDHNSNRFVYVEFENNWNQIAKSIAKGTAYKSYNLHGNHFSNIITSIINTQDVDSIKMIKAYNYVKKTFNWNEQTRYWIQQKFNDLTEFNKGSSSEINLYLVKLLQKAGLDAHLALLSTRDEGMIIDNTPFKSQFNQAIAYVKIDTNHYFLNATDLLRPYFALDDYDYNGKALIIDMNNIRWENLPSPYTYKITYQTEIEINNDSVVYHFKLKCEGRAAQKWINDLEGKFEGGRMKEKTAGNFADISNHQFKWISISDTIVTRDPLIIKFEVSHPLEDIENGDFYQLKANYFNTWGSNPFVSETRQLPVDIKSPVYFKYIVTIKAKDFNILADPQSIRLMLPYKAGYFSGSLVKQSDQQIMMISTMNLKKAFFYTDEYPSLREMVSQMIDFEQQEIIIERK